MRSKKKIIKAIIVLELLLIAGLSLPAVSGCFPNFFVIQSESMAPQIHKGDIVFIRKGGDEVAGYQNEIIAFYNPIENRAIFHRVVGVDGDYLITKGDNTLSADSYSPSLREIFGSYWFGIRLSPFSLLGRVPE